MTIYNMKISLHANVEYTIVEYTIVYPRSCIAGKVIITLKQVNP